MAVKAIEIIRKIRYRHYKETKNLSAEELIKFFKNRSAELQKRIKRSEFISR
jgi:hypothetical protein